MKNRLRNQAVLFILLFFALFSCKEEDKSLPEIQSKLTAEQQKERLDQEGINFINHVEDLEKPDLMDPLVYFIEISEYIDDDQFDLSSKMGQDFLKSAKELSGNSLKSTVIDDDDSFKRYMTDNQGIYTYNRTQKNWTKTTATGKVEFVFPANESTTSNNATFVFSNLNTLTITNSDLYEDIIDLPKTLDIELKVNNILKYGYYISNEFNTDNIPTSERSTLIIGDYKLVEEYTLTNNNMISTKSTMSSKDIVFFTLGATSEGNFSNDVLSADEIEEDDVINNVNAYVQIENVKVAGNIDFKSMADKIDDLEIEYDEDYNYENDQYPKAYYEKMVELFKANGYLNIRFVDKNEVFAKLVPYVSSEDAWDYEYDPYTGYYESIEYTRFDMGFKIEFTDGSKLDDSYFDSGFGNFVDKLNSIIDKINDDYDESIDEIDY